MSKSSKSFTDTTTPLSAIYEVMKLWSKQGNRDGKNVVPQALILVNGRIGIGLEQGTKVSNVKIVISKFNPVTKRASVSEKDARLGNFLYSILTSYPETRLS